MSEANPNQTYWADRETKLMLAEAFKRIDGWFKHVKDSGKLALWRTSMRAYYAGSEKGGKTGTAGDQDEFTTMVVNHVHNLGEHVVTAIAGQPPAFQPQAMNSDHESTAQTVIAGGVLEQAVTQKGLDEFFPSVTRKAVVLAEGWGTTEWDTTLGEDYAAIGNQITKTGDVRYRKYDPIDVVRDWNKESGDDHEWLIFRRWENRWNVLARVAATVPPEQAESWRSKILSLPSKIGDNSSRPRLVEPGTQDESEEIAVYELRHARTDALPDGRRCVFVDPEVWIEDGPLKFRDLGAYRLAPEEQIGSERGYSQQFDLLPLQQVINSAYSTVLSNHNALGHPLIWVSNNANMSTEELKPYTIIKSAQKPESLTLTNTPAEIPAFAKDLIAQAEILSGVNAVRRGNLDATGKLSGAAYALIDAKFIEAVVGLQRAYKTFAQRIATSTVWLYQDFAQAEQTLRMVGKSNRAYVKKFSGEQLKKIARVDVEMGNPMSRTTSGRLELATRLMTMVDPVTGKPNGISTPEQFMQVLTTGRLEPLIEGAAKELDNIKAENELLGDGGEPIAVAIDNHPQHIQEHSAVLASPEARQDQKIVTVTLNHIQEHMDLWTTTDPRTLAARGVPPPPMPAPPPGMTPPGVPGATSATPPPQPGEPSVSGPPGAADQPQMPSMPTNPGTGEPAPAPPAI